MNDIFYSPLYLFLYSTINILLLLNFFPCNTTKFLLFFPKCKLTNFAYSSFQMHFTGTLMTEAPPSVSDPTKDDSGDFKGEEDLKRLPWTLPVIIGGPVVIVLSKPRFPEVHIHCTTAPPLGKKYIFSMTCTL